MALDLRTNRRLRMGVALTLLAAAGGLLFIGPNQPSLRAVGLLVLLASVSVTRYGRPSLSRGIAGVTESTDQGSGKARPWWLGAILFAAVGISRWLLDYAALNNLWFPYPIYLFAGTVIAAAWWAFGALTRWV